MYLDVSDGGAKCFKLFAKHSMVKKQQQQPDNDP